MMLAPVLVIMSFALAKRKSSTNGGKAERVKSLFHGLLSDSSESSV